MSYYGAMNWKRKHKKKAYRLVRSKRLNGKKVSGWEYGGAIGREIISRRDYREMKRELMMPL